ncbi:MAG: LAGLIDADG family homing endonuclease [Nanoarchaeota archaeon]|nr:LAGLIDADG family homing endonuclease [Nanoarchaeota archaeon]
MNGRSISKEELEQFVVLYKNGESVNSIEKKLNRSRFTINKCLKRLNIKIRSRRESAKLGFASGRIKIFKHSIPQSSKEMSPEKAYVIGALCGDGYMYYKVGECYQIGLSVTDEGFCKEFRNCLYKVYKILPTREKERIRNKNWKPQYTTRLCSKEACDDILSYGSFTTESWRVPGIIKHSNLIIKSSFLRGIYDSEGSIDKKSKRIGFTSINKEGTNDIQELLRNYNVRSSIGTRKRKFNRKEKYELRIQDRASVEQFFKLIGFTITYKQEALKWAVGSYKLFTMPKKEVAKLKPMMIQLRKEGLSYEKIGKRLGVGTVTVWNHLRK